MTKDKKNDDKKNKKKKVLKWDGDHKKRYSMLFGYIKNNYQMLKDKYKLKDLDKETFIYDYRRQLESIIKDSDYYKLATKTAFYNMITRWLEIHKPDDTYIPRFKQAGFNTKMENEDVEKQNKQDSKEIENYRDHDYFINILESINYKELKTITDHYSYLLLALLVLQAPVRTGFYETCKWLRKNDDNNQEDNYIRLDYRGKLKIKYIINHDKVSNNGNQYKDKKNSRITLRNIFLIELLDYSYKTFPREYVFENMKTKHHYTQNTLLSLLRKITKVPKINFDIMRSSYVTYIHSQPNITYAEKEKVALEMRHSVTTASKNYYKVFNDEKPNEEENKEENERIKQQTNEYKLKIIIENLEKSVNDLKLQNENLIKENEKLKEQLENKKKSKEESEKKVYKPDPIKKRRNDVIYRANHGTIPKEETLKKYNIVYNKKTKKYE